MEDVQAILAANVRARRKALGLSQEDLAERARIDRTYVSGVERATRNPTVKVVARLAKALETTSAGLLSAPTASPGKGPDPEGNAK
jgi:transcriptional regulator with XRE-family HTH domain